MRILKNYGGAGSRHRGAGRITPQLITFSPKESDSSYTSVLTSCTSIILTYSYFNLEKKIKIVFIDDN